MQAAFNDNWIKTRAQVLYGPDYFPELKPVSNSLAQVFKSSKGEGSESVRLMYLLSVASAKKHVRLAASYFVPDDLAIETFIAARQRGVKIEIILAGPNTDAPAVRSASRSRWRELLEAGVEIYEYQPARYHCKVMIVDDIWVSVGSTNFDDRSFRLNDEANLNIYDGRFAAEQAAVFDEDKKHSRRVEKEEFKRRSVVAKIMDELTGAFGRQL
jgi:cardiolipin synthase